MTTAPRKANVQALKAAIRKAAGWKCQTCGMTNREHWVRSGRQLEVHRRVPGSAYTFDGCDVLCLVCHKRSHGEVATHEWTLRPMPEAAGSPARVYPNPEGEPDPPVRYPLAS